MNIPRNRSEIEIIQVGFRLSGRWQVEMGLSRCIIYLAHKRPSAGTIANYNAHRGAETHL